MPFLLHSPRLILRPFEARDAQPFADYRSDPAVAQYQGWQAPYSLEQAQALVAQMQAAVPGQPGGWYQIAIEVQADHQMIGDCAFKILDEDARQAEVGVTLARPFQGQGYAHEALTCLLDYLFGELGLHRVRANCDPANQASARALQRLHFRHEGRWVESLWFKGAWADEDWYALLAREWQEKIDD